MWSSISEDMKSILTSRKNLFEKIFLTRQRYKSSHFKAIIIVILQAIIIPFSLQNHKSLEQLHQQLVSFYDLENYSKALSTLSQIKEHFPQLYILNNYAYLEGRICQRLASIEQAIESYKSLLYNNSNLSDYAEFRLAEAYKELSDTANQQKHLEKIINFYPDSLFRWDAYFQLGEVFSQTEDYSRALEIFNRLSKENRSPYKYRATFLSGKLYQEKEMLQQALKRFYQLLAMNRSSDLALEAAKEIERIEKSSPHIKASAKETWLRFMVYFHHREFRKATQYGKKLISKFSQNQWTDDTLYYLGLAYLRQGQSKKARIWLQRMVEKYPKSPLRAGALYRLGNIELEKGDEDSFTKYFLALYQQYPHNRLAESALLELIRFYFQRGETPKGFMWTETMLKSYPNSFYTADALMQASKICWQKGQIDSALNYLENIANDDFSQSQRAEALYWKAKLYQQLGKEDDVVECYKKLFSLEPNGYYSSLVQQQIINKPNLHRFIQAKRLFAEGERSFHQGELSRAKDLWLQSFHLAMNDDIKQRCCIMLAQCYSLMEEYRGINLLKGYMTRDVITRDGSNSAELSRHKGDELLFLHLYDEAIAELSKKWNKQPVDFNYLYSLALLCQKANLYSKSIYYAEGIVSQLPQDYCFAALNENLKALLYPIYYYDEIKKYARRSRLDELFLAAVIREESRFDPNAKSRACARGLMQFIPSTAKHISRMLGEMSFKLEDLYNPEFSLKIGSKYLQKLLKEFKGNYLAALAAYNAGEPYAHRWLRNCNKEDPEQILLEISFRETKTYVKRVMSSYWRYTILFSANNILDKNLAAQFTINVKSFNQASEKLLKNSIH